MRKCICCGSGFRSRVETNLCTSCRDVVKKLEELPPIDPYQDTVKSQKREEIEHGLGRLRGIRYNKYEPRREGQYEKNWKWEGLQDSGALPDSWWESLR